MLIKGYLRAEAGDLIEEEVEVNDDATDEQIEAEIKEQLFGHIDWWWEKEKPC